MFHSRRVFTLTACLLCAAMFSAKANTYYVDPSGSDDAPGIAGAPFRTIQHAADVLQPGDTYVVGPGVYREVVRPANSGVADAPITFTTREDAPAVVSGAEPVTGWTNAAPGVWEAPCDGTVEQVFVDGIAQHLACWPNSPEEPMDRVWAVADAGTGPSVIVDAELPVVSLDGAQLHVLPGEHWVSWTRPAGAFDPTAHTLGVNADWSQDHAHALREGSRYYTYGVRALLDAPGEWLIENGRLVIVLPPDVDPNTRRVEVRRRATAFDLTGRAFIRIEHFRVFAANLVLADAEQCTATDCHVRYASEFLQCDGWAGRNDTGIVVSGRSNTLDRCSVAYSAGNGITLLGESNTASNCVVRKASYRATDCAAVWMEGTGNALLHSSLSDTGRSILIHRYLKAGRIEYNDMFNAGLLTTDLGITYCYSTDGAGTVIAHNWVHDNRAARCGVGIYIDNGSSNFTIHHNVSWNNDNSGIRLNTPSHNNVVVNNTVVNNGDSLSFWGPENNRDWAGCRILNNLFNNKVVTGDSAEIANNYSGDDPAVQSVDARDFRLRDGAPQIDAGIPVAGLTDGFSGAAPDQGAYESGAEPWQAGHAWGEPPVF